jgi:hypothetical protein
MYVGGQRESRYVYVVDTSYVGTYHRMVRTCTYLDLSRSHILIVL